MSRLVAPVVKLSKQKVVQGTVVDVLGNLCSVRLSTRGAVLHSLKFIGTTPLVNDLVFVDYRSGTPVVHTNSENLEDAIVEVQRSIAASAATANFIPSPPPETIPTLTIPLRVFTFATEGELIVKSGQVRMYNKFGESFSITKVFIAVNTAPTGSSILVDVHKNGATIFTTQSNRPAIVASAFTGEATTIENAILDDGDYLQMDLDQKGSTVAGSDLTVQVYFT